MAGYAKRPGNDTWHVCPSSGEFCNKCKSKRAADIYLLVIAVVFIYAWLLGGTSLGDYWMTGMRMMFTHPSTFPANG